MWMRIVLWAILIGSVCMGYLGIKTGSATNAVIGITVLLFGGLTLYFLVKIFLSFGFAVVKILLLVALIAIVLLSGVKGCQYLMSSGSQVNQDQPEAIEAFTAEAQGQGFMDRISSFFSLSQHGATHNQGQPVQSAKAPVPAGNIPPPLPQRIKGKVTDVRSGYFFKIGTHYIKLYGIDTPDPAQTCLDKHKREYGCGQKAKLMLEKLILNKQVFCQVAGGDFKGNYIATCKIGDFDVGASMLSAGWGVADRRASAVYIPYEEKAHKKKLGLWAGKFIAPWDAREKRETEATKTNAKQNKGFWESLFE